MDEVEYEDDMADDDEGDRHEEIAEDDDEKDAKVSVDNWREMCFSDSYDF